MSNVASGSRAERLRSLTRGMRLPLIAAPMFLVSGPGLVLAACRAGISAAFPTPNARSIDILEDWLRQVVTGHAEACKAAPGRVGPWALNLVMHSSYDRLGPELELVDRYHPPLVITALGSPAQAIEHVHAYGGTVFADVSSLAFARKAAAAGADGLVLVSAGAGGHTGKVSPFAFVQAVASSTTASSSSAAASVTAVPCAPLNCSAPISRMPARHSSAPKRVSPRRNTVTWWCARRSKTW